MKLFKYWVRLVHQDSDKLVKKACNVLCQLYDCGFYSWATKVFDLLKQTVPAALVMQGLVDVD